MPSRASGPYVLLLFLSFLFFLSFYSARDLHGLSADRRETLPHDRKGYNFKNYVQNLGSSPKKFGAENMLFGAISDDFALRSRIGYLRNGTRYRQSENGVANYDPSRVCRHNLVNFGPQMTKIGP